MIISFEQFDFRPLLRHLLNIHSFCGHVIYPPVPQIRRRPAVVSTGRTMDLQWSVMWFDGTICEKREHTLLQNWSLQTGFHRRLNQPGGNNGHHHRFVI